MAGVGISYVWIRGLERAAMALRLADVLREMKEVVAAASMSPQQRSEEIMRLAADFLLLALAKDSESGRVAILMVAHAGKHLVFAFPESLAQGNTLILDRHSIAGRVALGQQVLVENNVPKQPHMEFFERIPDPAGTVRQIQKMIAAPLLDSSAKAFGVVEVSRTGEDLPAAGADFTSADGENLAKSCNAFAPFIARAWIRG
jgi:hypothetical protein